MNKFEKPIVVISKCLDFEPVRYDGQVIPFDFARQLEPYVDFIKVCPEVEIGLGIPRDPIRIVKKEGNYILIQPSTGEDVTKKMDDFTDNFLDSLDEVDGFIFKSKSPTIGIRGIKVYAGVENSPVIETRAGFFASKILDKYKDFPIEEDNRLSHSRIRDHFLIKLFVFSSLRKAINDGTLEEFDAKNMLLFELYNRSLSTQLDFRDKDEYVKMIKMMFKVYPTSKQFLGIFDKIYYMFKNKLKPEEIDFIEDKFDEYKVNKISSYQLLDLLKSYLIRFDMKDILKQSIFEPYPKELIQVVDKDRDRDFWK